MKYRKILILITTFILSLLFSVTIVLANGQSEVHFEAIINTYDPDVFYGNMLISLKGPTEETVELLTSKGYEESIMLEEGEYEVVVTMDDRYKALYSLTFEPTLTISNKDQINYRVFVYDKEPYETETSTEETNTNEESEDVDEDKETINNSIDNQNKPPSKLIYSAITSFVMLIFLGIVLIIVRKRYTI